GGAAVPVQRSDWYWEEYAGEAGSDSAGSAAGATEFLVFVRYDVSTDAVHALLDRYSASATVPPSNATAMTAFPELAWKSPRLAGGALITRPGSRLERAGIKAGDIVTAVAGESVADATAFAKKLTDKPVKLTVLANDGDKVIDVR
ncbi:MAG TPA: PDZ domain-containing protein, partial [Kofleriaceae bacterium]